MVWQSMCPRPRQLFKPSRDEASSLPAVCLFQYTKNGIRPIFRSRRERRPLQLIALVSATAKALLTGPDAWPSDATVVIARSRCCRCLLIRACRTGVSGRSWTRPTATKAKPFRNQAASRRRNRRLRPSPRQPPGGGRQPAQHQPEGRQQREDRNGRYRGNQSRQSIGPPLRGRQPAVAAGGRAGPWPAQPGRRKR